MHTTTRTTVLIVLLLICSLAASAASVTLTWADAANPPTTTYSIKEAAGLCSGTPSFNTLVTGLTVKTYTKTNAAIGAYCYGATASFAGIESALSNTVGATVAPAAPVMSGASVASNRHPKDEVIVAMVQVIVLPPWFKRLHLNIQSLPKRIAA